REEVRRVLLGYDANPDRRYPVVYWLHGLRGNQRSGRNFVRQLAIASQRGHAPRMIAVLVNGMYDSFYCDSPDGKWPVESVIVKELIPHIDATYRTIARREARGLEGYSMGGYGAAHLAFKYPDVFGAVGIMAGALLDADRLMERHQRILDKMYGGDQAAFARNRPSALLEQNADKIRDRMRIRVAVGGEDRLQIRSQYMHELLARLKVEHDYEVVPGVGHSSRVFYETLGPRAFHFYRTAFARPRRFSRRAYPVQSQVIKRGDVEILTFDTAEEFHRLEELLEETRNVSLEPGEPKTLYFRSRMDGSVQPYSARLPLTYKSSSTWPVVVQLHGLNFNKVLGGGQRIKYRGMRRRDAWHNPDVGAIVVQCFG
ncbi:MAG: hypothetical protein GY953_24290, partial [bacterium]|nr:hypothetical protein [bacterium]